MTSDKKLWIYDIETLINCFTVTFLHTDGITRKQFVLCNWRNDLNALANFLRDEVAGLIGYNNLGFDSPVMQSFVNMDGSYVTDHLTPRGIIEYIYETSQQVITEEKKRRKGLDVKELDLFKLHHFDNPAKSTS